MDSFYQSFSSLFTNHLDGICFCGKGGLVNIGIAQSGKNRNRFESPLGVWTNPV